MENASGAWCGDRVGVDYKNKKKTGIRLYYIWTRYRSGDGLNLVRAHTPQQPSVILYSMRNNTFTRACACMCVYGGIRSLISDEHKTRLKHQLCKFVRGARRRRRRTRFRIDICIIYDIYIIIEFGQRTREKKGAVKKKCHVQNVRTLSHASTHVHALSLYVIIHHIHCARVHTYYILFNIPLSVHDVVLYMSCNILSVFIFPSRTTRAHAVFVSSLQQRRI